MSEDKNVVFLKDLHKTDHSAYWQWDAVCSDYWTIDTEKTMEKLQEWYANLPWWKKAKLIIQTWSSLTYMLLLAKWGPQESESDVPVVADVLRDSGEEVS